MTTQGDFKETVRQQADIVRIVGDYVKLKKAGSQNFIGLCPFHNEKTPSFSVHAGRQFFHCFGCGKSGDVFKFVQEIEKISFPEALRLLAQKLGLALPKTQYSSEHEAEDARQRGQMLEMHERAARFFEEQLRRPEAAHAREYLANRGLKEETVRTFGIGFAPDSGFLLRDRLKADFSDEIMRASGLFSWKEDAQSPTAMYSKFRNRVMFPIANENGKVIAFTGRTLAKDDKSGPKYLNSPETRIYSKSRVLYNLGRAKEAIRKYEFVVIVEGQMDCIAVYAANIPNVVASSGTAFTEAQVKLLGRYSKNIIVNFDPDTAGAAATDKSLAMLLEEEFNIKVLRLEAGFDPDLFIRKNGAEAYVRALKGSQKYFDYLVERAIGLFPVRTPEGKKNAINFLLPHIHRVPNRIVRVSLASDIAQKLGIDAAVLQQEFKAAATARATVKNETFMAQILKGEKDILRLLYATPDEITTLGYDPRPLILDVLHRSRFYEELATGMIFDSVLKAGNRFEDVLQLELSDNDRRTLVSILSEEMSIHTESELRDLLSVMVMRHYRHELEVELPARMAQAHSRGDTVLFRQLSERKQYLLSQTLHPAEVLADLLAKVQ